MTRFKFNLELVLQQRESKEKKAVLAQAKAHQEYLSHMECLRKSKTDLDSLMHSNNANNYFDELNSLMYRQLLRNKVKEEEKNVNKAQKNYEKCLQKTIEARKQKLILKKLKQIQFTRYIQHVNKAEQKHIDELATQMSLRNKSNKLMVEGGDLE